MRVMCTGRVDPSHIVRAFSKGVDGVFLGGCKLNECNYVTGGNYHALNMVLLFRKILGHLGLSEDRLKLEFMSGSEANVYVDVVNRFVQKIKDLGPLGQGEGMDAKVLELKLKALSKIIPYIRLVESERLRVKLPKAEDYEAFYASNELDELFRELIADKLAVSEIMLLLREGSLTAGEISKALGLTPSDTSRYLHNSARHGLVRYDNSKWSFVLAK